MNREEAVEQAIAYIEECRQTHVNWADWQETNPDWEAETQPRQVGDAEHHREWVEKYDLVLDVLRGASERLP